MNWLIRRFERLTADSARLKQGWPIWLVGLLTLLNGAWNIANALQTRVSDRIPYFLPFGIFPWTRLLNLGLGFILVYLSVHLFQRSRAAWWVATVATAIGIIARISHLGALYSALPPAVALTLLLVFRRRYFVRSESRNIRLGFVLLFASLLVALLYGTIGFRMLGKIDFGVTFSLQDGLVHSLRQYFLLGDSGITAVTRRATLFLQSLNVLGIVAGIFATYNLFRPIIYQLIQFPQARSRATTILEKYGTSAFDYFKIWPDKSLFFSPSSESFISYRMAGGVAFCLADPVGPASDRETVIRTFLKFCAENGWLVAVMMPEDPFVYSQYGLSRFRIGEEAEINLEYFTEHTYYSRHLRRVRSVFEREGYKVVRYKPPVSALILDEAEQISRLWLTLPHHREYGFFQGCFDRVYMEKCTLSTLRDANGKMVAFINEVPSYRPGEASFDLMRYLPGSHWGAMDYLFTQMMLVQKNEGYRTFNFAVAPFVGIGNRPDATLAEKAVNQIFERLDWFLHSKGIRQYKLKFEPQWRDKFVVYQGGPMGLLQLAVNVNRILK